MEADLRAVKDWAERAMAAAEKGQPWGGLYAKTSVASTSSFAPAGVSTPGADGTDKASEGRWLTWEPPLVA